MPGPQGVEGVVERLLPFHARTFPGGELVCS
jgi:hypothetical protein